MNNKNQTGAIIVYPSANKRVNHLSSYFFKTNIMLKAYFINRRKLLLTAFLFFLLFFTAGNCVAAHYLFKLPYILDVFFNKCSLRTLLMTYFIIFASGYTIFGSVFSVCFFAPFSFFVGASAFALYNCFLPNIYVVILLISLIILSFITTLFLSEVYIFYSRNRKEFKYLLISKSSAIYFVFSMINSIASVLLITFIITFIR